MNVRITRNSGKTVPQQTKLGSYIETGKTIAYNKMALKLYYDLASQPSRALYILLKTVKYDFESKTVALRKREHYTTEFTKLNRFNQVPFIDHNGFILTESVAIIKYLSRQNIIPENLYPKEIKQEARVNEFLEWQHIGLRLPCMLYFRVKYLQPLAENRAPDEKEVANYEKRMVAAMEMFDTKWLGRGNDFVTGNTVSVADLLAACELEQPRALGFNPKEKFNNIRVWFEKVENHFNPHYEEAHSIINKMAAKHGAP